MKLRGMFQHRLDNESTKVITDHITAGNVDNAKEDFQGKHCGEYWDLVGFCVLDRTPRTK